MTFWRRVFATAMSGLLAATVIVTVSEPTPVLRAARLARSTADTDALGSGVLVVDTGPRFLTPGWPAGLWHVTPSGIKTRLVGRRWRVEAWNPTSGAVVRRRYNTRKKPFKYAVLRSDKITPLDLNNENLSCASWSADGKLLAYMTGESQVYTTFRPPPSPNSATGVVGKLWVAHSSSPERPVQVAEGLFPECPAWSPTDRSLAYLIQGDTEKSWEMRLHKGHRTDVLKEFHIRAPSVFGPQMNRTFDFSNEGDLIFLARRSIYVNSTGGVTRFGPAGVLKDIRDPDLRSWLRFVRVLRVSPNGELVAATADEDNTGIVDSDELLRIADNRLRAWSGNYGIMTFGLTEEIPSAALYPVDSDDPPLAIGNARKVSIHADLGGEWFAHNVGRGRPRLIWRNPDGSVLSITEFGFRAGAVASIDGGVVDHGVVP